jgi:uncharacterized protein (DUF305 family)
VDLVPIRRLARRGAALLAVLVLAAACTATPDEEEPTTEALSEVVQPGRPGEENRTLSPEEYGPESEWNDADVAFVTLMIDHHLQALEMADLATTRAQDADVVGLAERITAAQGPEIHALVGWLQGRDLAVPAAAAELDGTGPRTPGGTDDHAGEHDGSTPHGMLSAAQLEALADATGAEFDRLFLEGMILHHQGAVGMAQTAMVDGTDLYAGEMAADVASGQDAEIARMQQMLDGM